MGINFQRVCILSEGIFMKNRCFVFPTLVLLWMILIFASPVQHKAEWKGTIEVMDGVTVVKNPKEPIYGEGVFLIEKELSIGEEGKGERTRGRRRRITNIG